MIRFVDVGYCFFESWIFGVVSFKVSAYAFSMKGVLARVDEKLAIIKDRTEANVAVLGRANRNVLVFLVPALRTQRFSVLRVLLNLAT